MNIKKQIRNILLYYFCNSFKINKVRICHPSRRENTFLKGKNCRFYNCNINILGKNNVVMFGDNCRISGLNILVLGDNNRIQIGKDVIINASKIQPTVINASGGKEILIGDNSMLSNNIEIHTTDYHKIYDEKGTRTNPDKDIVIGQKVWIGLGSKILKGSVIPNGSIIGAGTLIAGKFQQENCIIAGNPAMIIKQNMYWDGQK